MLQILTVLPVLMLSLATTVHATARFANLYQDGACKVDGSHGFKMGNTGCFNVGHALSYTTGNSDAPGQATEGRWCLIKYRDDECNCIDDYEVLGLNKGKDEMCHHLAPDPYHGSYHWHKIDVSGTGECPTSGCYKSGPAIQYSVPAANKISQGSEKVIEQQSKFGYVGVIAKRRSDIS